MTKRERLENAMIDLLRKQVKIKGIKYKDGSGPPYGPDGIPVKWLESEIKKGKSSFSTYHETLFQPDLEFELEDGKKAIGEWFYNNEGSPRFWSDFFLWSIKNNSEFWILTNTQMKDKVQELIKSRNIQPRIFILDPEND